jgi:hypothetical protein
VRIARRRRDPTRIIEEGSMQSLRTGAVAAAAIAIVCLVGTAWAASHSDAPLIKQDPQANLTDVYAFVGTRYDDPNAKVLNVVVHLRPFSEPGDGVTYERFAEDVRHSIHITNPRTGGTVLRYDFVFSSVNPPFPPGLKNPNTILSYGRGTEIGPIQDVGDARQNFTQTYSVSRFANGTATSLGRGLLTPPPNVGARTTPFYNDANGRAVSGAGTGQLQSPERLRRRHHRQRHAERLAERPPTGRRRRRHRAHRRRQRPQLRHHHPGRRQHQRQRPGLQPGLPLLRHAARRPDQSQGSVTGVMGVAPCTFLDR